MNPDGLNDDDVLALIALTRVLVAADGHLGVEEMKELQEIGLDIGVDRYTKLCRKVDSMKNLTVDSALELAKAVDREDAQALVRTMLVDLAATDGIDVAEQDLIDRLTGVWA